MHASPQVSLAHNIVHGNVTIRVEAAASQPLPPRWRYRATIEPLVRRLGPGFVGRQAELARLRASLSAQEGGYLLLVADGGLGKSALLVQLVLQLEREGARPAPTPSLLAFFVRNPGWRRPEEYLAALNAQLLELLRQGGNAAADLLGLRLQFESLWQQAVAQASAEAPLVLIVDALDEMLAGETTIADLLPETLGPWVHVIVSSRPRPDSLALVAPGHPLRGAERMTLANFDVASVAALLRHFGIADAEVLAPRVHLATGGEPLYARAVAEDIAARGVVVLRNLEQSPPAGLRAYFVQQMKALDEAARDDATWQACTLLAAAKGSMAPEELAVLLQRDRRSTERALAPVQRFLVGGTSVAFFHRRLYEAVQDELGEDELGALGARITQWCRQGLDEGWPKGSSVYALTHAAEHFDDAGDDAALQALVSAAWLREHRRGLRSLRGFVRDVELAMGSAARRDPPDLYHEWRGAMALAAALSVAAAVPAGIVEVLSAIGRDDEAKGYAQLANDDDGRAAALAALASGAARRGDAAGAAARLDAAIEARAPQAGTFEATYDEEGLTTLIAVAARAGGAAGPRRLEGLIVRLQPQTAAARWLARAGTAAASSADMDWAREVMQRLAQAFVAGVQQALEAHQAHQAKLTREAGEPARDADGETNAEAEGESDEESDEVESEADSVASWLELLPDLMSLCAAVPGADVLPPAVCEALRSLPRQMRVGVDESALAIALGRHSADDHRLALQARVERALAWQPETSWGDGLHEALRAASAAGRTDLVRRLRDRALSLLPEQAERLEQTFVALAADGASAGDMARCQEAIEHIELGDGSYRDSARSECARLFAARGQWREGLTLLCEAGDPSDQLSAVGAVARAALDGGDAAGAEEVCEFAVACASSVSGPAEQARGQAGVALALAGLGRTLEAREWAERALRSIERVIPDARTGQDTDPVAAALIAAGSLDAAERFVPTLMDPWRSQRQLELVHRYMARGDFERARALFAQRPADLWGHELYERCLAEARAALATGDINAMRAALNEAVGRLRDYLRNVKRAAQLSEFVVAHGEARERRQLSALLTKMRRQVSRDDTDDPIAPGVLDLCRARLEGHHETTTSLALALLRSVEPDAEHQPGPVEHLPLLVAAAGAAATVELDRMRRQTIERLGPGEQLDWLLALRDLRGGAVDGANGADPQLVAALRGAIRKNSRFALDALLPEHAGLVASLDAGVTLLRLAAAYDEIVGWWHRT